MIPGCFLCTRAISLIRFQASSLLFLTKKPSERERDKLYCEEKGEECVPCRIKSKWVEWEISGCPVIRPTWQSQACVWAEFSIFSEVRETLCAHPKGNPSPASHPEFVIQISEFVLGQHVSQTPCLWGRQPKFPSNHCELAVWPWANQVIPHKPRLFFGKMKVIMVPSFCGAKILTFYLRYLVHGSVKCGVAAASMVIIISLWGRVLAEGLGQT